MWFIGPALRFGSPSALPGLRLDSVRQLRDLVIDGPALGHQRPDLAIRMHHGRVVAATKLLADLGKGKVGQLTSQIHSNLASRHENPRTRRAAQIFHGEAEVRSSSSHDRGSGDF